MTHRNKFLALAILNAVAAIFCLFTGYLCLVVFWSGAFSTVLGIINLGLVAANLVMLVTNLESARKYAAH